ncbi:MFS transporter [Paracoccus aminophilus]|uniref:Permease n=1 Tax=Paracoccus aminophilus JCM 7686 TaxID=1367847 RepID=S5XVR3_PARAH|nr:MFS transporter [Paracoccus aminophilus]AGT09372.1 permease [Paracoccus aminophilus JCM 7686]
MSQRLEADLVPHERQSWLPMTAIGLGQMIMSFNVASLPVAMGGMIKSFNVPPTTIATGIVAYSMLVAGFVMLGAKLIQRFGVVKIFRLAIIGFCISQTLMTFSPNATIMITAQFLCGASAAVIVPSLVALIAENYHGKQQATAIGALGSARAAAGVLAFVIGGVLGTYIGWRPAFGILVVASAAVYFLSFKLKSVPGRAEVKIDIPSVILAAGSIILLSFGFNNLNAWGLILATSNAPFSLLGMSPALVMLIFGAGLGKAFFTWTARITRNGGTPLLPLEIIASPQERAAVYCMFVVVALEAALNFSVPLYIQIVQGNTPLATAIAMMPFNLTVFFAAMLIIRFYDRFTPRQIGQGSFVLCAVALMWLSWVVRNDWSAVPVLFGLVVFGIGQGALVTLLFNVLVTSSPKELAGDVGSLRGTTNNLAAAVGTSVAGAMMVGLLSVLVLGNLAAHPILPPDALPQLDLSSINFVGNDRLQDFLISTGAPADQVAAALEINTDGRLRALKFGLMIMAALSLIALLPAARLPGLRKGEDIPAEPFGGARDGRSNTARIQQTGV